jgi:hypothetical protein
VTDIGPFRGLSRRSRALYKRITGDYELGDHHCRILQLLCEALDRAEAAQDEIAEHGILTTDRFGRTRAPRGEGEARC